MSDKPINVTSLQTELGATRRTTKAAKKKGPLSPGSYQPINLEGESKPKYQRTTLK